MNKQVYVPRPIKESPLYELKSVDDIKKSELYSVRIDGTERDVYHTEFFDFVYAVKEKEEINVEIEVSKPFEKVVIRPYSSKVNFKTENTKITFSMTGKERAIVELDDALESPLYILLGEYIPCPEKADYVFESGKAYNIGALELTSNQVVYIEEGAVVSGYFKSRMADNIKICGNGIVYGGNWHKWDENSGEQLIVPVLGENIEIRGITLLDGGSWHIVPVACKNVLIEDVNILGKVITGDGIDIVGCENVTIRNCFIRANDDCISVKAVEFQDPSGCTDVKNILVENCLFWNAEFGNTLEIQEWSDNDNVAFGDRNGNALEEVFLGIPRMEDGYLYLNDKPGIGVDIDEKAAKEYPCSEEVITWDWMLPRLPDGTAVRP